MPTGRTSRQWNNVALVELTVAVGEANRRLPTKNDKEFVASVMEVINELKAAGLEFPERSPQRPVADLTSRRAPTPPQSGTSAHTLVASSDTAPGI